MIIITGATGKLGRAIMERLLQIRPASELGASVRDAKKAIAWNDRGVRVRQGDFADPASLRHAFEGASQVLIISSNSSGDAAIEHHGNAITAAKAVGARRVLYTSHMGANPASPFQPMTDHAATEALLKASGMAFTSLRNGFYADSALMMMGPVLKTATILLPHDGPVSWTAHSDLAEAAVIALTDAKRLNGITPPLTGSEALDFADIARIATQVSGHQITRELATEEHYREFLISQGLPEARAQMLVGLFHASRKGEFAAVDPTLQHLLARPPRSMQSIIAAHLTSERNRSSSQ